MKRADIRRYRKALAESRRLLASRPDLTYWKDLTKESTVCAADDIKRTLTDPIEDASLALSRLAERAKRRREAREARVETIVIHCRECDTAVASEESGAWIEHHSDRSHTYHSGRMTA